MSFGLLPLFFFVLTVVGVLGIVIHRTTICRFWRSEPYDRRKEQSTFDGKDRRRNARRGSAADRRK